MSFSINEALKNRDKENKKILSSMINKEINYKDKYLKKVNYKKKGIKSNSLGKIVANKKEKLSRNKMKNNYINKNISKKSQSIGNITNINKLYIPISSGIHNKMINEKDGYYIRFPNNILQNENNKYNNNLRPIKYLNKFMNNNNSKNILPKYQMPKLGNVNNIKIKNYDDYNDKKKKKS